MASAEKQTGTRKKTAAKGKKPAAGKTLLVVESPSKARIISKYLGSKYKVIASVGHVRDLPKSRLGVDIDNNFEPEYEIPDDKKALVLISSALIRRQNAGSCSMRSISRQYRKRSKNQSLSIFHL